MEMKKRFLAVLLTLCMVFTLLPVSALAVEGAVAQIGNETYSTLDEAVKAASDGATITVLADCTASTTFYKSLTFTGGHTVTVDTYGWRYNGNLVIDGAKLIVNSDNNSPVAANSEAGGWFAMVLNGSITAKNQAEIMFSFDSGTANASGQKVNCAIYADNGVTINVEDNSKFSIYGKNTSGVAGQGIQLDSTAGTGIYVKGNSTFLIDGTNRGYVNSPTVYVKDSTFTVQNCTSNASNGGIFTADNAKINFLNNYGHGLSTGTLDIKNGSVLECNNNAYYGVTVANKLTMDGTSKLTSNENGYGYIGGALRLASSSGVGTVEAGAVVTLDSNVRNALENYGTLTFEDGVDLTITNNSEPLNGGGIYNGATGTLTLPENAIVMYNEATKTGGGICNKGTAIIPASVKLYNNHAGTAGDDIYNTGTITFGPTGSTWALDGSPDCNGYIHAIDGWYDDSEGTRWLADTDVESEQHIVPQTAGTLTSAVALKAAHGVNATIVEPDPENPTEKDKTSFPGIDKYVGENQTSGSVGAGGTVDFTLKSNVPEDLTNYLKADDVTDPTIDTSTDDTETEVEGDNTSTASFNSAKNSNQYMIAFHDTMDKGLNIDPDTMKLQIKVGNGYLVLVADPDEKNSGAIYTGDQDPSDKTTQPIGQYDLNYDGESLTIVFDLAKVYLAKDADGKAYFTESEFGTAPIVVTYTAKADSDLTPGTYYNKVWVEYEKGHSSEKDVPVYSYGIKVFKYDTANKDKGLQGAVFNLLDSKKNVVATITSDENGYATYEKGLAAGEYTLVETTAPEGYVKSDKDLPVTLGENCTGLDMATMYVTANFANSNIPHTGGTGTLMFTLGGAALIAAAGAVLITTRKKGEHEK